MRPSGMRAALATAALVAFAAVPFAAATTYDAKTIVFSVDGLVELPPNYEYKAAGDQKSYTVSGRMASEDARVFLNVTSPPNVRAGDDSRLTLEYPVSWTSKGFSNDTKHRGETAAASVSFALGRLPASPPTGPVLVKATVDKTVFTLRILPEDPILVIDAPAEDGIAYVDVDGNPPTPITVRTLYYPEGDRLVGPAFLGGKSLGMPGSTDIRSNGRMELRAGPEVPCGLHPMSVASVKVKGTSTSTGTIYGADAGPLDAVAVLRAPAIAFPAGFVTDVAPAEISLKCFPPQSRVQVLWAGSATEDPRPLATFTVADSGGLDEFVEFPSLEGVTEAVVHARVVEGPHALDLHRYSANATVPVRKVASSDDLNLVVDVATDKVVYDLGDPAIVRGKVTLAGESATGVDVTVVWPFEDTGSAREDRLQARTVKTDAQGAFTIQFSAAPTGTDASFAPSSTEGDRVVLVTARKVGLNTGVARVPIGATGLAPFAVKDVKWRPEVVQPGGSATVTGVLSVPAPLAGVPGLIEGARIEVRADPLAAVAVGRSGPDGVFSVPVTVPAGARTGVYPTSVVAWGRAPDALGGVLLGPGVATGVLKVGAIDADPVGKDQRVVVKEVRSLGTSAASASIARAGQSTPAANAAIVQHGDRVVVARGSELVLDLAEQGATATLGNGTRVDLVTSRQTDGRVPTVLLLHTPGEVRLDSGDAAPTGERSVVVLTRFHEVTVTGTDAVVKALPDGGVEVQVWKGTAQVADREGGPAAEVASGRKVAVAGDASVAQASPTSLTGASPFAPPPGDDGDDGEDGTDDGGPATGGGGEGGGKTPFPSAAGLAAVALAAWMRRSRARS